MDYRVIGHILVQQFLLAKAIRIRGSLKRNKNLIWCQILRITNILIFCRLFLLYSSHKLRPLGLTSQNRFNKRLEPARRYLTGAFVAVCHILYYTLHNFIWT